MRPTALLAALLFGCSSPVIVVLTPEPDVGTDVGGDTGASEAPPADTAPEADTTPELDASDTGLEDAAPDTTPPPDTFPDTAETCTPLALPLACPASGGIPACGLAPDGCGGKGKVDCGGCTVTRRCAATASDPVPHCTCETVVGSCVLYSGIIGRKVKCGKLDAPLAEGSTLIPQPDGSVTVYCIPS